MAKRITEPVPTVDNLKDLVMHMYLHSGYRDNGYDKMSREERDLYLFVTNREKKCDECGHVITYAKDEENS